MFVSPKSRHGMLFGIVVDVFAAANAKWRTDGIGIHRPNVYNAENYCDDINL